VLQFSLGRAEDVVHIDWIVMNRAGGRVLLTFVAFIDASMTLTLAPCATTKEGHEDPASRPIHRANSVRIPRRWMIRILASAPVFVGTGRPSASSEIPSEPNHDCTGQPPF
jgi:hypothetical protein